MSFSPSKSSSHGLARAVPVVTILLLAILSLAVETHAWTQTQYTAQRKPRVTVLEFADTNTDADLERLGPSISAMLVTYLKRNSQFVVVERQDIKEILNEWERNQAGMTSLDLDHAQAELLENIDVFVTGKVTVLTESKQRDSPTHIEVDAKLLSRTDGRIITAAQRNGSRRCLRSIVARLGSAIQQDYLRPHFGKLRVNLQSPEYTRFYLTPVLRNDALAEEKPPVELSQTTVPGPERDRISPWITNPTSYTIENLLSGWYTVRLERPGYGGAEIENSRFQAVEKGDSIRIRFQSESGVWIWLDETDPTAPWRKFLVEVKPLSQQILDATSAGYQLPKHTGSILFEILDEKSEPLRSAKVFLRSLDLDLNPYSPDRTIFVPASKGEAEEEEEESDYRAAESDQISDSQSATRKKEGPEAENPPLRLPDIPSKSPASPEELTGNNGTEKNACEYLDEEVLPWSGSSEGRVLRGGQSLDLSTFGGGFLAFDSYQGQNLPTGAYEVVVWAPYYIPVRRVLRVSNGDGSESIPIQLERERQEVLIRGRSNSQISFKGDSTSTELSVVPDRLSGIERIALPVDTYQVHADLERFGSWSRTIDLRSSNVTPPTLEDVFPDQGPSPWNSVPKLKELEIPLKDEIWVGGRTNRFLADPSAYYDPRIAEALDRVLDVSQATRQANQLRSGKSSLEALEALLEDTDLLILDEVDMERIRIMDDVTEVIRRFIESGHAVLAFVTSEGDYKKVLGAPLTIRRRMGKAHKMILKPGQVSAFRLDESIELGSKRFIPRLSKSSRSSRSWRILARSKGGQKSRLLERGSSQQGGYVLVWLESAYTRALHGLHKALKGSWRQFLGIGGWKGSHQTARTAEELMAAYEAGELTKKEVRRLFQSWSKEQEANDKLFLLRAKIQGRALDWAEHLMFRRLGGHPDKVQAARERIARAE